MRPTNLTSKLLFTLLTAFSFSLSSPSYGQDANELALFRDIPRDIASEFNETLYEVRSYVPELDVAEFSAATIFYPLTLSFSTPSAALVLVPGYTGTQDPYLWWGPALASLGIVVMIIDTNDPYDNLQMRKHAHIAAVDFLKNENSRSDSPLNGKVDTNKLAIMGHSLGGGAALLAAQELGNKIKTVVALTPYCCELGKAFDCDLSEMTVPTLIIAGSADTITPPETHSRLHYASVSSNAKKAYLEFAEGTHNLPTKFGSEFAAQTHLTFAWLRLQMDGNENYLKDFTGGLSEELAAKMAKFESNF